MARGFLKTQEFWTAYNSFQIRTHAYLHMNSCISAYGKGNCYVYLHAHEEIRGLSLLEAVLCELPAHPLHFGALLRRAEIRVELPDRSAEEVVRRLQRRPVPLGYLELPHGAQ